jgi:uncharacterized protein (DUF1330 family)
MFEMTVGLLVADQETYTQYRSEIAPLLARYNAGFRYDFEVARTLKSEEVVPEQGINRLFLLTFPSRDEKDRFFADPEYVEIRARLFQASVRHAVIIAEYSR